MADSAIYVRATGVAGVDAAVDTERLTVGALDVERQRIEVTGASAAEIARVIQSAPAGTEFALVVRPIPSGTQDVNVVGGGAGGGPATVADGADVAEGALADAAVVTDTNGTLSGKLRGLVKWAFERMPAALGQGTKAQGLRVTLPSDQDPVPVYGARARGNKSRNTITLSGTAAETTLLAAVASTYLDLVAVIAINTSATAVRVDFRDDTGGSVVFALQIPAGETRGFVLDDEPIEQAASNKNWTAQCAATVTDVRIFAMAVKKT